jgi:hypothetical protein
MALLARAACAATLLAGCYSPDLRDCTVSCASSADCAGAQVCSADHLCAAKDIACSTMTTTTTPQDAAQADSPDAHEPVDAARMIDAGRPPIDAPAPVALHLHVDGMGGTLSFGTFSCTDDCTYQVPYGQAITVAATANGNHSFVAWSQGPCTGSVAHTCTVTPTMPLTVAARFIHGGGDD